MMWKTNKKLCGILECSRYISNIYLCPKIKKDHKNNTLSGLYLWVKKLWILICSVRFFTFLFFLHQGIPEMIWKGFSRIFWKLIIVEQIYILSIVKTKWEWLTLSRCFLRKGSPCGKASLTTLHTPPASVCLPVHCIPFLAFLTLWTYPPPL